MNSFITTTVTPICHTPSRVTAFKHYLFHTFRRRDDTTASEPWTH